MASVPLTPLDRGQRLRTTFEAYQNFQRAFADLEPGERAQFLFSYQLATVIISVVGLMAGLYLLSDFVASGTGIFSNAGIISVAQGANAVAKHSLPIAGDPYLLFAGEHLTIILIFFALIVCLICLLLASQPRAINVYERLAVAFSGALAIDALIHIVRTTGG
jgi:hypothetical protein